MSKNNHNSNQVLRCIKDFKEVISLAAAVVALLSGLIKLLQGGTDLLRHSTLRRS
jgi:hypothetical protein